MIYIASPYSHPNPVIREFRYHQVEQYTAHCMMAGELVFSPIVHCHNMAIRYLLPTDFEYWMEIDKNFIKRSDAIRVLKINGWEESRGVTEELKFARENNIKVEFAEPLDLE